MTRLSLALLGPVQLALDGQPVGGLAYNKARALLAYLAVESYRPHQRDALAALLWPEMPDEAARHNLRQALTNLREAIGDASARPHFLLITRDTIQFNPASDYNLDTSTFMALLSACESHAHRRLEHCRSCAARMQQAISLYGGEFLAGFGVGGSAPFEEWQLRQRERLHQRALDALVRLADHYERRGEDEQARRYAQRQIELDPWREEAHRQLMRMLAHAGQRSAALAQYETCRRILERDLGVEPEAQTTKLYEQIRDRETGKQGDKEKMQTSSLSPLLLISPAPRQNFPAQPTSLIGRETALAELGALLENPAHRLITIVGPGGIGKTRLALAAAAEQAELFADGATFVPLQAISSAAFLAPAILSALDVALQGQREPREQLLDYLRDKELLLVLDNLEQLLGPDLSEDAGGVALLTDMLERAPGVTLLITSRERLALPGEWLFDLSGLSYPRGESAKAIEIYSAVQLFMQRARQVRRQFTLSGEAHAVARICRLVEGLPLAIELAAAALRTRSITDIAEAIEGSVMALAIELRAIPERQRSMWATFEHSWRLLSDEERQAFTRLSVFRGGFHEDAAAQVAQATPQLLAALLDKSLLRWDGAARYDMHELVRQYAGEKLRDLDEEPRIRDYHLAFFLKLAKQAEPQLSGPRQMDWLQHLNRDLNNLRAALEWSLQKDIQSGLQVASALKRYWEAHSPLQEGIGWLEKLLCHPRAAAHTATRAKALTALGWLNTWQNENTVAHEQAEEGMALYRALGDQRGVASALFVLGWALCLDKGYVAARPLWLESLALYRTLGDTSGITEVLSMLGAWEGNQDNAQARAYLEEGLILCRELGDIVATSDLLYYLGKVALRHGDYTAVQAWLAEALVLKRSLGGSGVARVIESLGELALVQGEYEQARDYFEESVTLCRESGQTMYGLWASVRLGYVALRQGDTGRAGALLSESLQRFKEVGNRIGVVYTLEGVASLAVAQGQPIRAVSMFGWADAMRGIIANSRPPIDQADVDRDFASIRTQLDEAAIEAAWIEGCAMTLEQVVAYALEGYEAAIVAVKISSSAH